VARYHQVMQLGRSIKRDRSQMQVDTDPTPWVLDFDVPHPASILRRIIPFIERTEPWTGVG
jgi:hypothetical protein